MLRLDQREHDAVSFDAGNFKALHEQELRLLPKRPLKRCATPAYLQLPATNSREPAPCT